MIYLQKGLICDRLWLFIPWPRHISCRNGCVEMCNFCTAALMFLIGHGVKARNSCPCWNHTFPNSGHHQGLESTRPAALCFPGPDDAPICAHCGELYVRTNVTGKLLGTKWVKYILLKSRTYISVICTNKYTSLEISWCSANQGIHNLLKN